MLTVKILLLTMLCCAHSYALPIKDKNVAKRVAAKMDEFGIPDDIRLFNWLVEAELDHLCSRTAQQIINATGPICTLLHRYVYVGFVGGVLILLAKPGINKNMLDYRGQTPLMVAQQRLQKEIAEGDNASAELIARLHIIIALLR